MLPQTTILLHISFEIMLKSEVIVASTEGPDDTFQGTFE